MVYKRLPWRDQFSRPTPTQLRKSLPEETVELFDHARTHLLRLSGVQETVTWYGQSWCWSIEYRTDEDGEPLAVLIPSPSDLQLAMPLDQRFITSLPLKRMKRAVRDGLDMAAPAFDIHWGVWSIQQGGLLEDLEDLTARRLKHLGQSTS